jgi:hypothetical protein
MMQRQKLLKLADGHDAVSIYKLICDVCDLSTGLSQDDIRTKYTKVKICGTQQSQERCVYEALKRTRGLGRAPISNPTRNSCIPSLYGSSRPLCTTAHPALSPSTRF